MNRLNPMRTWPAVLVLAPALALSDSIVEDNRPMAADGLVQVEKAFRNRNAELQQQSPDVIGQRGSIPDQQLARSLNGLQTLLFHALERRLLDMRPVRRFGHR